MHRKFKVLLFTRQLTVGGQERQLIEFVKLIDKTIFEPVIFCLTGLGSKEKLVTGLEDVDVDIKIIHKRFKFAPFFIIRLWLFMIENHFDIVHCYSANSYGLMAARMAGVPIIYVSERLEGFWRNSCQILLEAILFRFSEKVIANAHKLRQKIIKQLSLPRDKVVVIHNGIDTARYSVITDKEQIRQTLGIGPTEKVITTVGRLSAEKNQLLFLKASKIVLKKHPDAKFILVGDGPLRLTLEDYVQKNSLYGNTIFLGTRHDIPQILSITDIFVSSSQYEGLSNSIMEAMAAGCPCVVTDVGGSSELIEDGLSGFVVPASEPEILAEQIIKLIENEELSRRMAYVARQRIEKFFTVERMRDEFEELYKSSLNHHSLL